MPARGRLECCRCRRRPAARGAMRLAIGVRALGLRGFTGLRRFGGRAAVFAEASSGACSPARITMTTRRFALRPSRCHCSAPGRNSPKPMTRAAPDPRRLARSGARRSRRAPPTAPSSTGTWRVLMGRLSVWPSTRTGFGYFASVAASASSARQCALSERSPRRSRTGCRCGSPLRPRWNARRTATRSASTSGASAFSSSSATRPSARRHDDLRAGAGLVRTLAAARAELRRRWRSLRASGAAARRSSTAARWSWRCRRPSRASSRPPAPAPACAACRGTPPAANPTARGTCPR